jgi:hypothetical protein
MAYRHGRTPVLSPGVFPDLGTPIHVACLRIRRATPGAATREPRTRYINMHPRAAPRARRARGETLARRGSGELRCAAGCAAREQRRADPSV